MGPKMLHGLVHHGNKIQHPLEIVVELECKEKYPELMKFLLENEDMKSKVTIDIDEARSEIPGRGRTISLFPYRPIPISTDLSDFHIGQYQYPTIFLISIFS